MGFRVKAAASVIVGLAAVVAMLGLAGAAGAAEPITASNDALRTGWYPDEPKLDPATVAGGKFGQIFETPVQGQVYAQPLVADGTLLVVTEKDRAYGLDPVSGAVKWERKVGDPFPAAEIPNCSDMEPDVGITGTPVIDPATGIAYFYAKSQTESPKTVTWKLHALNVATGEEAPGFPVRLALEARLLVGLVDRLQKRERRLRLRSGCDRHGEQPQSKGAPPETFALKARRLEH